MGIVEEDVAKVRDATDIVAVISEHLALKKVGRRFVGLCPFHGEHTPSFSVNPELGLYYCFGCQAKGDAITFVREMGHTDFVGAVETLAHRAGIPLHYTTSGESEGRKVRARLVEAMGAAVDWYHQRLLQAPDAAAARAYLRSRGFDGDTVRTYQLGWAPEGWDELSRALSVPAHVLVDAGLAYLNQRQRPADSFRARVLFPIFDPQGDPVAFGGRILPGAEGPKYKNTAETKLYDKSRVLYGLNWHKTEIVAADEVIVCEGYTDVIGLARAGFPRAVAPCGTALTDAHARLLRRFARRVVLAFDADAAGQAAAERFYAWEQAHDLEVFVADLPAGVDPSELAQRDPERLGQAVAGATPFLRFRVERVLGRADLAGPEGRARAAEAAVAVIREHPNELVRDQYLVEVADRCLLEVDRLRTLRPRPSGDAAGHQPPGHADGPERVPSGSRRSPGSDRKDARAGTVERQALAAAIHDPGPVADLLDEALFDDPVALGAFRALAEADTLHEALERAAPDAAELLAQLAAEELDGEAEEVVCRLIETATDRALRVCEMRARRSEDPLAFAAEIAEAKILKERLSEVATRRDAAGQLLGWLQDTVEETHD